MTGKRTRRRDRYTVGIERSDIGTAVKNFGREATAEFEKARALEAALAGTPFRVPHAIHCDQQSGCVEFEYVEDAVLLQEIIEQAFRTRCFHRVLKLNDSAAQLLGILHQRLNVENAHDWKAPGFLVRSEQRLGRRIGNDEMVSLHCDYSPVNLLIDREEQIAVIDASPNSYFTNYACLKGPRLVDVATYTAKLSWPYRLRSYSAGWQKMATLLRRRFLGVYDQTTGRTIDLGLLGAFESAVVRAFVEWKTTNPLVRSAAVNLERAGFHRSLY